MSINAIKEQYMRLLLILYIICRINASLNAKSFSTNVELDALKCTLIAHVAQNEIYIPNCTLAKRQFDLFFLCFHYK